MGKIILVALVTKKGGIGYDNNLLYKIPEDLKFFKELTTGKTVVMGRNTFESLDKPLPNRTNIVLSSTLESGEGYEVVRNIEDLMYEEDDLYIIGGETLYNDFIDIADEAYINILHENVPKLYDATFFLKSYFRDFDVEITNKLVVDEGVLEFTKGVRKSEPQEETESDTEEVEVELSLSLNKVVYINIPKKYIGPGGNIPQEILEEYTEDYFEDLSDWDMHDYRIYV